jgi:quercetin dioxygenase-like cupin family protein
MARDLPPSDVLTGAQFHVPGARVYAEPIGPAIHKRAAAMARVVYTAVHENREYPRGDDRRGHGRDHATWVFSEEPGLEEGLFHSGLELMIDARLEPGAAIGLHPHGATEEVYYLLEGELSMTTVLADGREVSATLHSGDAHGVRLGESHWGRAGAAGCRFLAVAFRRR